MKRSSLAFASLLLLVGCGGGSGGSSGPVTTSRASFQVQWPSRTRLIPTAANSLVVTLSKDGVPLGTHTIRRPAGDVVAPSVVVVKGLPFGDVHALIKAYPTSDGSGVAQAEGESVLSLSADTPGSLNVSLVSTVTSLEITAPTEFIDVGGAVTLVVTAHDADGHIVLLSSGSSVEPIDWKQNNPSITSLAKNGLSATATGLAVGATTITATLYTNGPVPGLVEVNYTVNVAAGRGSVTVQ